MQASGTALTWLHAAQALTPQGWRADVRIAIDGATIASVGVGVAAQPGDARHAILLPAMPNLHSHAFQRGMAGLAETRGPTADSFWTWRETMYRFALSMTPDDVEAVAAQLYVEMLEAGFSQVGEFHYLHHDRDGGAYANVGEMAERIASACAATGIGLTLLPVFYAHSGFGGAPPNEGQRRFVNSPEGFARLMEASRAAAARCGGITGVAPHSLRAATPGELRDVATLAQGGPIHIHIAEQRREVDDCIAATGLRPVDFLFDNANVDARWCLIHATHMSADETQRAASSGAVAGLCPITEANLGDGTFGAPDFLREGGAFGIGSDSNVRIGGAEELRTLEYSQRLHLQSRNVLAVRAASTGRSLYDSALAGGAQALGISCGVAAGARADFVTLDAGHPSLAGRGGDALLDAFIFGGGDRAVDCVYAKGVALVRGGAHVAREAVARRFGATMRRLLAA